ncbi:hypothetical protein H8E88_01980 [candidate division KSB1 bacterium]|nr:hypothetical protein [candidate division KSB1 bacterium]
MTLQELYDWAKGKGITDLPLYTNDGDCRNVTTNLESEIASYAHYEGEEEDYLSTCCGATPTGEMIDVGICPECKEHTEFEAGLPERIYLSV